MEEPKARLTKLEEWLVERVNHDETPFDLVFASSNPGLTGLQSFPAWECWWESYRTIDKIPYNNILRLDQEILFAGNIIISQSSEALARQEAYLLAEEVDRRIVGQSPLIENVTDVILPIFDADASFSQMEGSGLFTLTIYYIFIWRIAKGGSDA